MATTVIDTLEIARELREAGLSETQAEAIARQFEERYDSDRDELVSRAYLDAALERQTVAYRAELARLERDLILKLTGIVTAAVAVVGALGILF